MKYKSLFFLMFLFLVSCYPTYGPQIPVYYNVINATDEKITVVYQFYRWYHPSPKIAEDTIVEIDPGEESTLIIDLYTKQDTRNGTFDPEPGDSLKTMIYLKIIKNDSDTSQSDFLRTDRWDLYWPDEDQGILKLVVKMSDFNIEK